MHCTLHSIERDVDRLANERTKNLLADLYKKLKLEEREDEILQRLAKALQQLVSESQQQPYASAYQLAAYKGFTEAHGHICSFHEWMENQRNWERFECLEDAIHAAADNDY